MHRLAFALLTMWSLITALPGQLDRYQVGLRLRAFERHLERITEQHRRKPAFAALERAVQAFFRLDLRTVAQSIDEADCALRALPRSPTHDFARGVFIKLDQRLVDAAADNVNGEIELAYSYPGQWDTPTDLEVWFQLPSQSEPHIIRIDEWPPAISLPLGGVISGDYTLTWKVVRGDDVFVERQQGLSVTRDPDARIKRLAEIAKQNKRRLPATIESQTLPAIVSQLRGMRRKRAGETVLPGHALLLEAEALAAWLEQPTEQPFYGTHRKGDQRLRIPVEGKPVSMRLHVPDPDEPRPLVIALHGAGGSENLFFDGYGDGRAVALAKEREWYIVAPRATASGIDAKVLSAALAERYAIDLENVFVVGHSMGAMHAVRTCMRSPKAFRAVAALGGGGTVRDDADLSELPFFVGIGEKDFLHTRAKALHRELLRVGATSEWREYANVEHLAIVQLALPDVFVFFDRAMAESR